MPYKRLSRFSYTFSIPQIPAVLTEVEFFNSHEILRQATDDLMIACEHSNTFSLFPSLELLPDAAVSEPVLLFGRLSPTRR